jgi:hypothetical protein
MNKLIGLTNLPDDLLTIAGHCETKTAQITVSKIILTPTMTVTTVDSKLHAFKEDKLYADVNLRTLVPRGCCFVFMNGVYAHTLYGHPKFGNIDDYLSPNSDDYDTLVFRRKENGECSHWSGFQYDGVTYEMFGSKNVHFVVRPNFFEEDVAKYTGDRYGYATKMAKNIRTQVKSEDIQNNILNYFVTTGNTFCAESCFAESQHLVKYDSTTVLFFGVTGKRCNYTDSVVKVSPMEVDNLFTSFGLPLVTETIVVRRDDQTRLAEVCTMFERAGNSEGAVVYRVNSTTGDIVFAYKHKNFDYIFRRALREKMRSKSLTSAIVKRLENLHITHPKYNEMLQRGLRFNAFFRSLPEESQAKFFDQWVSWEEKFDKIDSVKSEQIFKDYMKLESMVNVLHVIMFVAIPFSGKSFVARTLEEFLTKNGNKIVHLEQDMFFDKKKKACEHYENAIKIAMQKPDVQYIILTKGNHMESIRNTTYRTLEKCTRHVTISYVTITAEFDIFRTKEICLDRSELRGFAHASLYGKTRYEYDEILTRFAEQYQPLTEMEKSCVVVNLEIEDDRVTNTTNCISQLQFFDIIPQFDVSDESLANVFNKILMEDKAVAKVNEKKFVRTVSYDAIVFGNISHTIDMIDELGNEIKLARLKVKDEYHVTLKYYGKELENTIGKFVDGIPYDIRIVGYAVNSKAVAYMVELPSKLDCHTIPHITVALSNGTKASYSSELLNEALSTDTLIMLDHPIMIKGVTRRIYQ